MAAIQAEPLTSDAAYEAGFIAGIEARGAGEYKAMTCLWAARKALGVSYDASPTTHAQWFFFKKGWNDAC